GIAWFHGGKPARPPEGGLPRIKPEPAFALGRLALERVRHQAGSSAFASWQGEHTLALGCCRHARGPSVVRTSALPAFRTRERPSCTAPRHAIIAPMTEPASPWLPL